MVWWCFMVFYGFMVFLHFIVVSYFGLIHWNRRSGVVNVLKIKQWHRGGPTRGGGPGNHMNLATATAQPLESPALPRAREVMYSIHRSSKGLLLSLGRQKGFVLLQNPEVTLKGLLKAAVGLWRVCWAHGSHARFQVSVWCGSSSGSRRQLAVRGAVAVCGPGWSLALGHNCSDINNNNNNPILTAALQQPHIETSWPLWEPDPKVEEHGPTPLWKWTRDKNKNPCLLS